MTETNIRDLRALGAYLATRRDAILEATRHFANRDPAQTTIGSLTKAQFDDHIPPVLDGFARKLQELPGDGPGADAQRQIEENKHGLHRWQQGYRLRELLHEWGHLHHSIFDELESFARSHPEVNASTYAEANRQLIAFVNEAVSESAGQYARLQQDEASGHLRDLQRALTQVQEIERSRGRLIHQAVHDLRGNVQSVSSAADVLRDVGVPENERIVFLNVLQQGVEAVATTMTNLMDLARLEAGQERRRLAAFDASELIGEFCSVTQSIARERDLYLRVEGPPTLPVEGDAEKVRRILQNLVLNALKYTTTGGVTVSWAAEGAVHWWIMIKDTGPGLMAGPGAPMVGDLKEATAHARESEDPAKPVLPALEPGSPPVLPAAQQPGEGIGLSIVKRLCELLDASLELASSTQSGTVFRLVLPRTYSETSSP